MNDRLRTAFDMTVGSGGTLASVSLAQVNAIAATLAALATAAYMGIRAAHAWRNYREKRKDIE
jgi:hypothetical protein